MATDTDNAIIVNTAGERCPMPLMKTRRAVAQAKARGQQRLSVWATDLMFGIDVQATVDIEQAYPHITVHREALPEAFANARAEAGTQ